jgi:natural product precursor
MKSNNSYKKLTLNKKTILHLNNRDLSKLRGGGCEYYTCAPCDTWWQTCIPCPYRESYIPPCP